MDGMGRGKSMLGEVRWRDQWKGLDISRNSKDIHNTQTEGEGDWGNA